jgi:hypothetical protein
MINRTNPPTPFVSRSPGGVTKVPGYYTTESPMNPKAAGKNI